MMNDDMLLEAGKEKELQERRTHCATCMFEYGSTITAITAILGVVLSAFALGWQFYRDLSNRPCLRVNCWIGLSSDDIHTRQLIWSVTNYGRAPVHVISMSILTDNSGLLMTDAPIPKMLDEAEYFLYHLPLDELEPFKSPDAPCITALQVNDSLGKTWKAPQKQVNKINRELVSWRQKLSSHGSGSDRSE